MAQAIDTTRVDAQIEKAKARLSELYAKRREIIAANKPRKRVGSKQRIEQVSALARAGADMATIVEKTQLSKHTIRYYLWSAIAKKLREGIREGNGDYAERELKLKTRLYPGIKWCKATSRDRSYPTSPWSQLAPRTRIMHRNSDGSIMGYFYSDGTPAPAPAEKA